jgi:Spy/CpxP family protein refolding chaperone
MTMDDLPSRLRTWRMADLPERLVALLGEAAGEIERRAKVNEDYALIAQASERELAELRKQVAGLLAINESLRREIREQRTEMAELVNAGRESRPWRNENPEGGWIP